MAGNIINQHSNGISHHNSSGNRNNDNQDNSRKTGDKNLIDDGSGISINNNDTISSRNNLIEKENTTIGTIPLTPERVKFLAGLYERSGRTVQAEDLWIHAVDIGLSTLKDLGDEIIEVTGDLDNIRTKQRKKARERGREEDRERERERKREIERERGQRDRKRDCG